MKNEQIYIENLRKSVIDRISDAINEESIDQIVNLVKSRIDDKTKFHSYYLEIVDKEEYFLDAGNFFRTFKNEYSLQGIDNNFLDNLEKHKEDILKYIHDDKLVQLYFDFFKKAELKQKGGTVSKELGSFFSKLVHTFRPKDYCALDNPIKNEYFKLQNESFFISFLVISAAYKQWANDNRGIIQEIRNKIKQADKKDIIKPERLTDLKLLDLIFWSKANLKKE